MGTTEERPRFTRGDYYRLPEGFPAQLVRGALVREPAPAPWHQGLVLRIADELRRIVDPGRVLVSPVDVDVGAEDVYHPDVLVLPEGTRVGPEMERVPRPVLVVEVLSPPTEDRDRGVKKEEWLRAGVGEVWHVDPRTRTVERWTREGSESAEPGETIASRVVAGFALAPDELFRH